MGRFQYLDWKKVTPANYRKLQQIILKKIETSRERGRRRPDPTENERRADPNVLIMKRQIGRESLNLTSLIHTHTVKMVPFEDTSIPEVVWKMNDR